MKMTCIKFIPIQHDTAVSTPPPPPDYFASSVFVHFTKKGGAVLKAQNIRQQGVQGWILKDPSAAM